MATSNRPRSMVTFLVGMLKAVAPRAASTFSNRSDRLKSRHIQFIALGGTIGTGLFLGVGSSLAQGGPLSILLGYTMTGLAVFAMVR